MVATRRGARTEQTEEPEMNDTSLSLRKKPVRRATAAKAAQSAPKTKTTTRSRKADTEQEDAIPESQPAVEEPKPTTTRATRSRRAETVEPEPSEPVHTAKTTAQPKQPARARSTKAAEKESETPKASTAATSKPALAARPTRQTRAKAPAAQPPLSPKKITQVSKARTRNTRALADGKLKLAPNTRATSTTQTTRTTRKRTVSDENAEIPELMPAEPVEEEAEVTKKAQIQKRAPSRAKVSHVEQDKMKDEEEALTTRETTPAESPAPGFVQPQDYNEDNLVAADAEEGESESEAEERPASDDELCGPKTPMRRSQEVESRYYASTKKAIKRVDPEVPLSTPPKRYGANGAARPTPQTQKPHLQHAVPESAIRPMTIGRAADRPFVFRKLEKEDTPTPNDKPASFVEEDLEQDAGPDHAEQGVSNEPVPHSRDLDHDEPTATGPRDVESDEAGAPSGSTAVDPDETIILSEDDESDQEESEMIDSPTVEPPVASYEDDDDMADIDSPFAEPPVASYNQDESMLDLDSPTTEPPIATYESDEDGSVVIHARDEDSEGPSDDDDEEDASHLEATMFGLQTPKPQTIPWQNLREETTRIPVDFDLHFANVRSPTHAETEFTNEAVEDLQGMQLDEVDDTFDLSSGADAYAPEPTMTLNDFIDVSALAEPTMQLGTVAGAGNEDLQAGQGADKTEDTVLVTRDESHEPAEAAFGFEPEHTAFSDAPSNPSPAHKLREALKQLSPLRGPQDQNQIAPLDFVDDALEDVDDEAVPHYALPTLSSRRKSMSALGNQTPMRSASRPRTSDGASIARIAQPFDQPWWARSRRSSVAQPAAVEIPSRGRTTSVTTKTPIADPVAAATPGAVNASATASKPRFPRHSEAFDHHARTVAAPTRFRSPARSPIKHPATIQKLPSQQVQRSPGKTPTMPSMAGKSRATPGSARSPQRNLEHRVNTESGPRRFHTPISTPTQRPDTSQKPSAQASNSAAASGGDATPQERYPRRSARQAYNEHASTVAAPARFRTPIQGKPKRPATAQKMASQSGSHPVTPPLQTTPGVMPRGTSSQKSPEKAVSPVGTPSAVTPQARYPRLPAKRAYEDHASTVAASSRFRSPAHPSPKRPATSQKPVNLRKMAMQSSFPTGSHTPIKTPLKPAAMTPSQVPMTPHPGAPLRGVVALVEVFTLDGASASAPFISLLQRLGAKTTKSWSERVTHVIFKDGSPTTLQRVRINNKEVKETGKGFAIHCVNSRWVSDCDESGSRVDETNDAYAVDVTEVPRGGNRRRKSMEPSALINVGGNIVRDRKSSGGHGRNSIGRSAMKPDTPGGRYSGEDMPFTPGAKFHDLENQMDFDDDESEASTPDYLGAPDKLVQMTAPMNRVRKLELKQDEGKNRRLTFWNGST